MTDETTVPTPDRLFTWVDVDEHFARLAVERHWPAWLLDVSAYWDGVEFVVRSGTPSDEVWLWLARALGPITVDPRQECVFLEKADEERTLPVVVEERDEAPAVDPLLRWAQRRLTPALADPLPPPESHTYPGGVELCSFHSYKGGVGRTLHCVALAMKLNELGSKVLVVDADLEAPGITWMAEAQGAHLAFAFEDFLALLHGSPDGDTAEAVSVARKFLVNQEMGGVFVLPARRSAVPTRVPGVDPADLLVPGRSRYHLTESLAVLGQRLGADVVLLDLRAGVSELNAPFLLDPRVSRVFVTTLSDQSVRGTAHVLSELGRRAPGRSADAPFSSVLITQFEEKNHSGHVDEAVARLARGVEGTVRFEQDEPDATSLELRTQPMLSPFDPRLLALPAKWDDVCAVIDAAGLGDVVAPLAADLRRDHFEQASTEVAARDQVDVRRDLAEHAEKLVHAETASPEIGFLRTESLSNLVTTHRTDPPVEVVIGAKGSGKTFTFQVICRGGTWQHFATEMRVNDVELDAPVVPVLASTNFRDDGWIAEARSAASSALKTGEPATSLALRDLISQSLEQGRTEVEWRRIWLACLTGALGLGTDPAEAEVKLTELARSRRAVFVIDGLEDLFQDFGSDQNQQKALRALLTGCTEWFRSLRGRPLGLIVFVRHDLVVSALQQNSAQFLGRYRTYRLRWDSTEALRLVAWAADGARALPDSTGADVSTMQRGELSRLLLPLWGERLGTVKSREAGSEAWFLAALTDFTGQIQARDIVRFTADAAKISAAEEPVRWFDRLLTPTSMRQALPLCSAAKISEISEENRPVGALFARLRELGPESRRVPFEASQVGLAQPDVNLLVDNGVLFFDEDRYWMPEIYRTGLGFRPEGPGRSRVLAIAKRVARLNDSK